jgi:hypothetical protein
MKRQAVLEAAKQWYRDYKVADSYEQFSTFVENLKRDENSTLLESVQTGIKAITENSGYSKEALSYRLGTLAEAALSSDEEDDWDEDVLQYEEEENERAQNRSEEIKARGETPSDAIARELAEDKKRAAAEKEKENREIGYGVRTQERP